MTLFDLWLSFIHSDVIPTHREDIALFAGAICGATIYTLSLNSVCLCRRLSYFSVSLILGIYSAGNLANILNRGIEKIIPTTADINKTFTAALAAAIAVRLIDSVTDLILSKLAARK